MTEVVSRAGSASGSTGYMLWRATMAWQREVRSALEPHGLTHAQFVLLASAWWLGSIGEEDELGVGEAVGLQRGAHVALPGHRRPPEHVARTRGRRARAADDLRHDAELRSRTDTHVRNGRQPSATAAGSAPGP